MRGTRELLRQSGNLAKLRARFPEVLEGRQVVALHVRDDYEFMQPELVDELQAKLAPYVDLG